MNLLIVYARSEQEILNRKSALGSYIFCLADVLQECLNVKTFINGVDAKELVRYFEDSNQSPSNPGASGIKQKIKSFVPKRIVQHLSERKLFQNHKVILDKLLNSSVKFDQVIEFYTFGSSVGYEISTRLNIPLHLVYDSPVMEQETFFKGTNVVNKRYIISSEQKSLKQAASIVAYSEPVKAYLINTYQLNAHKFHIHQNVDYTRFDHIPPKTDLTNGINICFLGSFLKWHRVDLLVEVFEELCEKHQNIKLHLIGSGMEFDFISRLVEKSPHKARISLPGFLDGEALLAYKSKMHIGLMPGSNWYGAPNKIFEYGAAGMAVISCRTPTICDIFDEDLLRYFDMGDKDSLKQELDTLLSDVQTITLVAEKLQNFVLSTYNREKTAAVYGNLLEI